MNLAPFLRTVYLQSLRTSGLLLIGAASLKNAYAVVPSDFYDDSMAPWTFGPAYLGFSGQPEQTVNWNVGGIQHYIDAVNLGYTGKGTLNVSNGTVATIQSFHLGTTSSGDGALNVSGNGTQLSVEEDFIFGSGSSTLTVTDGASVEIGFSMKNGTPIGTGSVTVSGDGSSLQNDYAQLSHVNFQIEDHATLKLAGTVSNSSLHFTDNAKAEFLGLNLQQSSLTLDQGSELQVNDQQELRLEGATFTMDGGSTAKSNEFYSVAKAGTESVITISGTGTVLSSENFDVEDSQFTIQRGALFTGSRSYITTRSNVDLKVIEGGRVDVSGVFFHDEGTFLVSGAGTELIASEYLEVGVGQMTLSEGSYTKSNLATLTSGEIRVKGVSAYSGHLSDTIFDVAAVQGMGGSLVYAHIRPAEDPYYLTYTPKGSASMTASTQAGAPISFRDKFNLVFESGATVMTQATELRGEVRVNGGHFITQNANAVGSSQLFLESGKLQINGTLNASRLLWSGGQLWLDASAEPALTLTRSRDIVGFNDKHQPIYNELADGSLTTQDNVAEFVLQPSGIQTGSFELIRYESTNFDASKALATIHGAQFVALDHTFELRNNALWINIHSITTSGEWLQNSAPLHIPTTSTFLVSGQARTGAGNEANTIHALTFEDQSSLDLFGDLTITSGKILTQGSASISGETLLAPNGLIFSGFGHLDINSDVNTQGEIVIGGGTVAFNAGLRAPSMVIQAGKMLVGSGTMYSDITNRGTLAPGNSPGTLTIVGDYTQTSSGLFDLEIESANSFDRLLVSEKAKLDGKLQVRPFNQAKLERGQSFRFLEAGEVVGQFAEVNWLLPNLPHLVDYGDDHVTLHVLHANYTRAAKNENEHSLAKALNRSVQSLNGTYQSEVLALDVLGDTGLRQAFHQVMPTYTEAALASAVEMSQNHGAQLHQYLSARRLADRVKNAAAVEEAPAEASAKSTKQVETVEPVAAPVGPKWNVWHQASGLFSQGGVSLNASEQFDSGTLMVGADHALSDAVSVGIFTSFQSSWADYANQGSIDSEAIRFGLYGTVDLGGFYANVAAGYGDLDYDFHRPVQINTFRKTAKSDVDGEEFFGLIGAGYDQRIGNWTFGPQFSLQYSHATLDASQERGAGLYNLAVDRATTESLRTQLGGRVAYEYSCKDNITLIPEIRAFWQHEFLNGDDPIRAALDSGEDFRYQPSARGNTDTLFIGAGVGVKVGERFYGNVYYNTDFGRSESNHTISLNVGYKF